MSLYCLILCLLFYVLLQLAFLGIHKTSYYANIEKKRNFFLKLLQIQLQKVKFLFQQFSNSLSFSKKMTKNRLLYFRAQKKVENY